MENSMSPADMRAVLDGSNCGYGDGWGGGMGGGWFAWILLFALFGGGGFGGWGNRGGNPVTEADLCNANSFSELKNSVGRMNDQQAAIARQTDNAICQIGYQNLQNTNAITSQLADCCCTTQRAIDGVKFDMANYASAIQMNDTANTQKVLDKLCSVERALSDAQKDAQIAAQGREIDQLRNDLRFCRLPVISNVGWTVNPVPGCTTNYGCGCGNGTY